MAHLLKVIALLLAVVYRSECQDLYSLLLSNLQGPTINSFASPVPGSNLNTISGGPNPSSQFAPPAPPQVLTNAVNAGQSPYPSLTPPQGAAPVQNSANNFMNMVGSGGAGQTPARGSGMTMPVTGKVKVMVDNWANKLGHKAYYEAHGCVDPTKTLMGQGGQMARMGMMFGCNNPLASQVCEMAQASRGGRRASSMRMMVDMMMPPHVKAMYEQCLTPTTIMQGMMPGQQQQMGLAPPHGAAPSTRVDCSSVSQMMMMSSAEGMMSPEHFEQIAAMRNRFLKMQCQESSLLGSLPYRLCCPGKVKPPTMQEAMMLKSVAAGA